MKMVQWLEISGTYQDLSKGNHHLQIVPTQSGREESQKKECQGDIYWQIWYKVGAMCTVWYQKDDVN